MRFPMIFAVKVKETIDDYISRCDDKLIIFELSVISDALVRSIEIARPLISENEQENLWLIKAQTVEFDGIEKGRLLGGLISIKPDVLRWLLLITKD